MAPRGRTQQGAVGGRNVAAKGYSSLAVFLCFGVTSGLDNGLELRPAMGWNSWRVSTPTLIVLIGVYRVRHACPLWPVLAV